MHSFLIPSIETLIDLIGKLQLHFHEKQLILVTKLNLSHSVYDISLSVSL